MLGNAVVMGAVLAVAGIALGVYDHNASQSALVKDLSIQTQIIAANSASALLFNDSQAAETTLSALRAAPNIVAAEIADREGQPVARFDRASNTRRPFLLPVPDGQDETYRFEDRELVLTRRVVFQDKELGVVSIASDYEELNRRRTQYIAAVAAFLLAAVGGSLLWSWRSQRAIIEPIRELAAAATKVAGDKDFSMRVPERGRDREVMLLTRAFNAMLSEIEVRDHSLTDAHSELERRVEQRTADLDRANKELEAFSYSVSHDLRAPLRHVAGFANLLEEHVQGGLDERGQRYLRTITKAAARMGRLIDDLLSFSRMGREQLSKRRVNLNDLVRDVRQETAAEDAGEGKAPRSVEWSVAALPTVEADSSMLRLVFVNLFSNALKYSATRPTARIEVGTAAPSPGEVAIFVRDNGVGFDMTYVDKLFGVFQRLHRSDLFEGTGIGLANVKRIIQRHGGRVWAEGVPDQGATFYFTLPTSGKVRDAAQDA